jgi:hypothetical protein
MEKLSGNHEERLEQGKQLLESFRNEPPETLLSILEQQQQELATEVADLSDAQGTFRPSADEWSVLDTCSHLAHSIRNTALLARSLARGKAPKIEGGIQGGVRDTSLTTLAESRPALDKAFAAMTEATQNLEGDCDGETIFEHPWFGPMNAKGWVAFNALHVMVHVEQIERIKESEDFPTS